ncbi:hypothetical protein KY290_026110 [Solanum tuberosum]|uniref:AIPP2-like SPOC-like domain-containing protein n=1 Tax=Solanum tuberosum TaxID=4113 RepID=A0ABQ7UVI1_SOLTU|nr:hypothetical protein KY289_025206 [Solanum tuberosum]KAH0677200.1 hypothetical protein KY285_025001 [Solanum tuberosum]KAH0755840.1 hypothetical protein KY290_026110 [Solanum tuberosum]
MEVLCYCLDKVTFIKYVPWVCDECKENEITRTMNFDAIPPVTCLVEHSHAAQPVVDTIWRGCYNIWNNKYTLDGVVAHLSDKGSQSVSEKAKLLQLHLHFEMVSKDDLLPKYFNTPKAIVDDIELFFFPSEYGSRNDWWRTCSPSINTIWGAIGFHIHRTAPASLEATQVSSSRLLVANRIQTPDNVLAARYVVNDRAPTEDDAQVMTDELGRGKRIRKTISRLDEYICL